MELWRDEEGDFDNWNIDYEWYYTVMMKEDYIIIEQQKSSC